MKIQFKKLHLAVLLLGGAITGSVTALPTSPHQFKNLKVLPKNISSENLSKIMIEDFEDGLGVSCNYCHVPGNDPAGLDYANDAKPEKQIARHMMRMTLNINRNYFKLKHPMIGDSILAISCVTCHNGQPRPGEGE